jgi:hypothetical protein
MVLRPLLRAFCSPIPDRAANRLPARAHLISGKPRPRSGGQFNGRCGPPEELRVAVGAASRRGRKKLTKTGAELSHADGMWTKQLPSPTPSGHSDPSP